MTKQQGPAMIEAQGLSKYFGDFAAIKEVKRAIASGEENASWRP